MPNYNDLEIEYTYGNLDLGWKGLTTLAGCPQHITGYFDCRGNFKLSSLVGGPQRVDGDYDCSFNQLTDLVGCASHITGFICFKNNKITSLVGIHKIIKSCNIIHFDTTKIIEGGIGLLLIDNLTQISNKSEPFEIIEKHIGSGTKGMMECSKELKAKGWSEYAKL